MNSTVECGSTSAAALMKTVENRKTKSGKSFHDIFETVKKAAHKAITDWLNTKDGSHHGFMDCMTLFTEMWAWTSFQPPSSNKNRKDLKYDYYGEKTCVGLSGDLNNIGYKELSSFSIKDLKAFINEAEEGIKNLDFWVEPLSIIKL
ncbi:hypothetical protein FACS189465_0110 [Clostridia bacterium]|nr:hypothetical protein FACS189465_0110 [Clostridia bacterium]